MYLDDDELVYAIVWSLLPQTALRIGPRGPMRLRLKARTAFKSIARSVHPYAGPKLSLLGTTLFVSTSQQNARVLDPIAEALAASSSVVRPQLSPLSVRHWQQIRHAASRASDALVEQFQLANDSELMEQCLSVAITLFRVSRLVTSLGVRTIVVGSQHNPSSRAVLATSTIHPDLRTVYIPHAPVADNVAYKDLPVHYALLRGLAEVSFYKSLGADEANMRVVGMPTLPDHADSVERDSSTVVVIGTMGDPPSLQRWSAIVDEGANTEIVLCPHPRATERFLEAAYPVHWRRSTHKYACDHLRREGAKVVVMKSSGTGLEALFLGIPVVELCEPGCKPNYPFISEPYVSIASSSDELTRALLSTSSIDYSARHRYARDWIFAVGSQATRFAIDAIREIGVDCGRPEAWLLDSWRDTANRCVLRQRYVQ